VITNLEAEVKKAAQARENAIESVQKALANDHASELVTEMNRAVRIQKLVDGGNFPAKHLRTKGHMDARERVHAEQSEVALLQLLGAREAARSALPPCTHLYEEALARVRSLQANGSEDLEAAWEVLDAAEIAVEQAEADLAAATGEWDNFVSLVNHLDGYVVKLTKSNRAGAATVTVMPVI
jgi:hypothetical protein